MTLQDFINTYNGQKVRGGQCGSLVRQYWIDVDHTNPPSYENSKDYWFNPVPGYDKVSSPQPGDIAIYNGHGAYTEGHSAIYVGNGQVFEQNADPDGAPAHLFTRTSPYLLGYLRKQGQGNEVEMTEAQVYQLLNDRDKRLDLLAKQINDLANSLNDTNKRLDKIDKPGAELDQAFSHINQDEQRLDKLEGKK